MTTRCQLWRYRPDGGGDKHAAPGTDRRTWAPCRERVVTGEAGCEHCYQALLTCPNARVRLALVRDPRTPDRVLEWFTTDGDESVAQAARTRTGAPILPDVEGPGEGSTVPADEGEPAPEALDEPDAAQTPSPVPLLDLPLANR